MSNYSQVTAFTPKDSLSTGNPAKVIKGSDFDAEFAAISTAIISKVDSTSVSNVDNTSDLNKPISTATQTALNAKQDTLVSGTNIKTVGGASLLGSGNISVGTGDVVGPATTTDNTIVRYDGTTGKLIQSSAATLDDSGNIATSGNLTLTDGTITYQKSPVSVTSGTFTCTAGITYILTGSSTATLPASPAAGTWVTFVNRSGLLTCTIARNSQNIMGLAENMTLDSLNACVTLTFADATRGWVIS